MQKHLHELGEVLDGLQARNVSESVTAQSQQELAIELASLKGDLREAREANALLQQRFDAARREARHYHRLVRAHQNTLSWKVTQPLRIVRAGLERIRKPIWQSVFQATRASLASAQTAPARTFLDWRRFDLVAKVMYARAYLSGNGTEWANELYREHLRVWGGFTEREPKKSSFEDFTSSFESLLDDMTQGRFRSRRAPVTVASTGQLFDGAHRVAASLVANRDIAYRNVDQGVQPYDWTFFRDRGAFVPEGLDKLYLDAMAIEYIKLAALPVIAVIIYPAAGGDDLFAKSQARALGASIYETAIEVSGNGRLSFIHQLYLDEPWNNLDDTRSIEHQANLCLPSESSTVQLLLIESSASPAQVSAAKQSIRDHYGIGKSSVHMTDTREEAIRAAQLFCNENTEHSLNELASWPPPPNFRTLFGSYRQHGVSDERCIDSSSTLALYGLRDARDIDYLHLGKSDFPDTRGQIESHNPHAHWYAQSIDSIVTNPRNYLFYCGHKFASLQTVAEMKRRRGEEKDRVDLDLIGDRVANAV